MAVCGRPTFHCSISVSLIVYKAQTWNSSLANYLRTHFVNMTDFWEAQPGIEQNECDRYAETVVGSTIRPLSWQGCHSYTVESNDGRTVVQFRAARSPLDENTGQACEQDSPQSGTGYGAPRLLRRPLSLSLEDGQDSWSWLHDDHG